MAGGTGGRANNPNSADLNGGTGGSQLNGTAATAGRPGGGGGGGGAGGGGLGAAGGGTAGVIGGAGGSGGIDGIGTAATLVAGVGSTGGAGLQGGGGTDGGGGGGGGEGGYGAVLTAGQNITSAASVLGGTGGIGGSSSYGTEGPSLGGAGGDGGLGLLFSATNTAVVLANTGAITGGNGGGGGIGGGGGPIGYGGTTNPGNIGVGGPGGNGAVGLLFTTAAMFDNDGTVTGGAGGAGGVGYGQVGATGIGAAAIVGSSLSIMAEAGSTIVGGTGRTGRADAIDFLSGTNVLTLRGGTLTGTILDGATDPATSLTFNQATAQTLSNTITGVGRVVDTGSGTLTLTNTANTYSGGTTLSGGTLDVALPTQTFFTFTPVTTLGTGAIAFDGGTLGLNDVRLANNATIDAKGGGVFLDTITDFSGDTFSAVAQLDGSIGTAPGTNAGIFTVSAAALPTLSGFVGSQEGLVLTGTATFEGGLAIVNTSVNVGNGGSTGTLVGNVVGTASGTGYGVLGFNHSAATTTVFAGNLSGDIGLEQDNGITVLTGTNTYTRATLISRGTLRAGSAEAFSAASQITDDGSDAEAAATTDLAGFNETIGGLLASTSNYTIRDVPIVTNSGSAGVTLTIAAGGPSTPYATQLNQSYGGYGRFFDGIIRDGDPALGGGTIAVDVGGNLNLAMHSTYTGGTTIEAGGTLTFLTESAGQNREDVRTEFGGVVGAITDNGTLSLVSVASYGVTGPLIVANAISGRGGVTATVDPANAAFGGVVILTGADTYTGATLVDHGTLQGGGVNAFGVGSAVTVNGNTFGHGATLDLGGFAQAIGALSGDSGGIVTDGAAAATLTLGVGGGSGTFLGAIKDGAGALALTKVGTGTQVLSGTNSYTGGTTIAAGTLEFASNASLPPGTIAFAGQAVLQLDATPANGASFADPLGNVLAGDALDLRGLAFAAGASATVSGNRLTVTSGGTTETFTLSGAAAAAFSVTQDAAGGTLVTGGTASPVVSIAGTVANQPASDAATIHPFARVTVTDTGAGQIEAVTVAQGAAANGVLTDPNAATDGSRVSGTVLTLSGTAAQVTAELAVLVFTPTAHQVAPGRTVTTGFTLGVVDTAGATASDAATSVVVTAQETPPAIAGTRSGQAITDQQTATPFAGVTITDPDAGASETATITLSANGTVGTISGAGLTRTGTNTYTLAAASPAAEQAALRALVFTPATGTGTAGNTVTNQATLSVSDGIATAADSATSIVVTQASTGTAMGDVHMVTLDGLHYDFNATGDFTLVRSTQAGNPFDIQVRTQGWAEQGLASLTTQVAARVGHDVVDIRLDGSVLLNGVADTALDASHPVQQLDGGTLTARGGGSYQLDWATGEGLGVSNQGFFLNLHATVAANNGPGSVQGLLGTLNGWANDLALPDGTVLLQPVPEADMLGTFAHAWQVAPGASMLDGGVPVQPMSLGLPAAPSFVIATAPGEVLTGSLGQAAPGGVTIQASLSKLAGAIIVDLASQDAIDLTGVALTAAELSYGPAGTAGVLMAKDGADVVSATIVGPGPSAAMQVAPDLHGGTLIRFA